MFTAVRPSSSAASEPSTHVANGAPAATGLGGSVDATLCVPPSAALLSAIEMHLTDHGKTPLVNVGCGPSFAVEAALVKNGNHVLSVDFFRDPSGTVGATGGAKYIRVTPQNGDRTTLNAAKLHFGEGTPTVGTFLYPSLKRAELEAYVRTVQFLRVMVVADESQMTVFDDVLPRYGYQRQALQRELSRVDTAFGVRPLQLWVLPQALQDTDRRNSAIARVSDAIGELSTAQLVTVAEWISNFVRDHRASCVAGGLDEDESMMQLRGRLPKTVVPAPAPRHCDTAPIFAYRLPLVVSDPTWCVVAVAAAPDDASLYQAFILQHVRAMQRKSKRQWFDPAAPTDLNAAETVESHWRTEDTFIGAMRDELLRVLPPLVIPKAPSSPTSSATSQIQQQRQRGPSQRRSVSPQLSPRGRTESPSKRRSRSSPQNKTKAATTSTTTDPLGQSVRDEARPVAIAQHILLMTRDRVTALPAIARSLGAQLGTPSRQSVTMMELDSVSGASSHNTQAPRTPPTAEQITTTTELWRRFLLGYVAGEADTKSQWDKAASGQGLKPAPYFVAMPVAAFEAIQALWANARLPTVDDGLTFVLDGISTRFTTVLPDALLNLDISVPCGGVETFPTLSFLNHPLWDARRSMPDVRSKDLSVCAAAVLSRAFHANSLTVWPGEDYPPKLTLPHGFMMGAGSFLVRVVLEHVELLTEIGDGAFAEAKALRSVTIRHAPNLLTIGDGFGARCPLLDRIKLETCVKLETVGNQFAARCTGLHAITFTQAPLRRVGADFFTDAGRLASQPGRRVEFIGCPWVIAPTDITKLDQAGCRVALTRPQFNQLRLFEHQDGILFKGTLGITIALRFMDFITRQPKEELFEWHSPT